MASASIASVMHVTRKMHQGKCVSSFLSPCCLMYGMTVKCCEWQRLCRWSSHIAPSLAALSLSPIWWDAIWMKRKGREEKNYQKRRTKIQKEAETTERKWKNGIWSDTARIYRRRKMKSDVNIDDWSIGKPPMLNLNVVYLQTKAECDRNVEKPRI